MKPATHTAQRIINFIKTAPPGFIGFVKTIPGWIRLQTTERRLRHKWLRRGFWTAGAIIFLPVLLFILTWFGTFGKVPDTESLLSLHQPNASRVYSADGRLMGKYYTKNRNTLSFEEIPPAFITALIATEDARFWAHSGIDFRSWMRVLVKRIILGKESAGGGSTLSQQLAKNLFPRKKYRFASTLINKYREFIIATRFERAYDKDALLTRYANTVPFGENIFGIDAAADRYFSKTPGKLTIEECALLVGLLKATTYYNPRMYPDRALARRNTVLQLMYNHAVIDSVALDSLQALPIALTYQRNTDSEGIALYFRNHIRPYLLDWCARHTKPNGESYNLYTDGLKIYTTLDYTLQQYAEEALAVRMAVLQEKFDRQFKGWNAYEAPLRDATQRSPRYQSLLKAGHTPEEIDDSMNVVVPMQFWTWNGMVDTLASPIDSIRHYLKMLQGSLVAIEPRSGGVLVWVGGNDARQFQIDYVLTHRHPGSAFKPLLFATAIEEGIDPCTYYANDLISYPEYEDWSPENSDGTYGGHYSLTGALANSINTIAVQLIFDTGIDNVVQKARNMGIKGPMEKVPSLALGTAEVTLLELTSAYTTFLNRGNHRPAYWITRIEDAEGNVLEEFPKPASTEVFSEETCGILQHMLANVVHRGTGGALRQAEFDIRGPLAGKTGTTQFQSDGLFVGMTPSFVAGVWTGCFDRRISFTSLRDGQGGKTALPVWGEFVKRVQANKKYRHFFSGGWPEEYAWINDCPFTYEESGLEPLEEDPEMDQDSTQAGPKRYRIKPEKPKGLGKLLEDIFGKKN